MLVAVLPLVASGATSIGTVLGHLLLAPLLSGDAMSAGMASKTLTLVVL